MSNKLDNIISESIHSGLKRMINEYADRNHIMPLFDYLNMTDEKKIEALLYDFYYMFYDFMKQYHSEEVTEDELYDIEDKCENYNEELAFEIYDGNYFEYRKEFVDYIQRNFDYGTEIPAYLTFDNPKLVKNEWLIHFSDNAYNIATDGFAYGTDDMDDLNYSGAGDIENKFGEGYDFAYEADDFGRFYSNRGNPKYGSEAVLFRATGVRVWHPGDEEYQVIFWGPSAKDFIYIEYDAEYGYDWCIKSVKNGNVLYYNEDLEKVVEWAQYNYAQYRKHLIDYDGNKRNKKYETNYQ